MKQIVSFCDKTRRKKIFCNKTSEKTTIKINDTELILKQQLEKKDYEEIQKTITSNELATKFKKYNSLKYKPTPTVKVKKNPEETGNAENRTYAEVTRGCRNPARGVIKTDNAGSNQKHSPHKNYAQQVQQTNSKDKRTI